MKYYPKVELKEWMEREQMCLEIETDQLVPPNEVLPVVAENCGNPIYSIEERAKGNLKGRAYFLPGTVDWVIGFDDQGILCLVPLKKGV